MFVHMIRTLCILLLSFGLWTEARAGSYTVDEVPNVQVESRYRFTSNPDEILSEEAVAAIDSICYDLRRRDIAQVAVVAVDDIEGEDVFTFAYELFSKWGVGRQEENDGLGILLVKERHEIRFLTGGGLEGVLTDALCKRIQMNYMLPYFRDDAYSEGMVAGMQAIDRLLSGSELDDGVTEEYPDELPVGEILLVMALGIGIPCLLLAAYAYRRKRCPHCGRHKLEQQSTRIVNRTAHATIFEATLVCAACGHTLKRRRVEQRDNHFGGRGGGGRFLGGSGGFFGGGSSGGGSFGGGSFGGGGAGSKW